MTPRFLPRVAAIACVILAACLTVNVYFYPSKEVDETAKQIIEDIRGGTAPEQQQGTPTEENPADQTSRTWNLISAAYAAEPETTVSTPAIVSLKAKLKSRSPLLLPYFQAGALGEGNDGIVVIRDTSTISMKDRAQLNALVKEENQDRLALYGEVGKELKVKDSDLPRVRKSFAKEWQKTAVSGWWVQKDTGEWIKVP
jgi:uncharacterized protein YdbL (DUF1318 family)